MFSVLSCSVRTTILRVAMVDFNAASQMQKQNERLTLSGIVRLKSTPVILDHGFRQLRHNALCNAIIGVGLLIIGGVFVVLLANLITPLHVLYPVILMMTAIFIINVVNFQRVFYAWFAIFNINTFMVSLEKKREVQRKENFPLAHKKFKLSTSELLLLLFDSGFSDNLYAAFGLIDTSFTTFSTDVADDLDSDGLQKRLLGEHKCISDSLKRICTEIDAENKSTHPCAFTSHVIGVRSKLQVDLCWDIAYLVLNSVGCFGFFIFPVLTLFPFGNVEFISNATFIGNLVGNVAWLIEPLLFAMHKNIFGTADTQVSVEKKNK